MRLPKNTIEITADGINWVEVGKLADKQIRFARDVDGQNYRAKKERSTYHGSDPRFTFASVTQAHVDHMAATGLLTK